MSADERPRTVCGFALLVWLVWLVWLLWLGMVFLVLRGLSCFLFLFGWGVAAHPRGLALERRLGTYHPLFFEIEWSWAGKGRARGKFCGAWQVLRVSQVAVARAGSLLAVREIDGRALPRLRLERARGQRPTCSRRRGGRRWRCRWSSCSASRR